MILTYKVKHKQDYKEYLKKAHNVAVFAVKNKESRLTTAHVKQIGLPSVISNQILRKYTRNKTIKVVQRVKLTVPNQGIQHNKEKKEIYVSCLKLRINYFFDNSFSQINQIEIDGTYCYVSVTIQVPALIQTSSFIGVDLNTTGHCAVVAHPDTGKVVKLGKGANHYHQKYKHIRRTLQKKGDYRTVMLIKSRESRIVRNMNHQISKKIINIAIETNSHIKMENLKGIRQGKKHSKKFNYALNSWSFYQLRDMIEYKAKKHGVGVFFIDPAYTSQTCSRCGVLGSRNSKVFKCPICGHADHADANASFNIGQWTQRLGRLQTDRDVCKGNTDTPRMLLA